MDPEPIEKRLHLALQALNAISCTSHDADTRVRATRTLDVIDAMSGGTGTHTSFWYLSPDDPMRDHSCTTIATLIQGRGRSIWLGELTEPIKGEEEGEEDVHWDERYCLHVTTPFKQFVMGLDGMGDGACLGLICAILQDGVALNQTYIDRKLGRIEDLDPENPLFE